MAGLGWDTGLDLTGKDALNLEPHNNGIVCFSGWDPMP